MPQVSVITSVYNREDYIEQAIKSVIEQTYENIQYIVIDDGSNDCSWNRIQKYSDFLHVCIRQTNQGMAAALNKGLSYATGDYVLFLSSDDYLQSDALKILVDYMECHPDIGMVDADGFVVSEEGAVIGKLSEFNVLQKGRRIFLEDLLTANAVNVIDTALHRRVWLNKLKGPFDEAMSGYEDWDLAVRLAAIGCPIVTIGAIVCNYRIHKRQKSSPTSWIADKRRNSLKHFFLKTLDSSFYLSANEQSRFSFISKALWGIGQGDLDFQEQLLSHQTTSLLPIEHQGKLWYYTGVNNYLLDKKRNEALNRLFRSAQLTGKVKYRLSYTLFKKIPFMAQLLYKIYRIGYGIRNKTRVKDMNIGG